MRLPCFKMDKASNGVYYDSKRLEEMCFLKMAYDLFPRGEYLVMDLQKRMEDGSKELLRWRSEVFSGPDYMSDVNFVDYFYEARRRCVADGLISQKGGTKSASNKIMVPAGEVEAAISDPWRSLATDVDGFSGGRGMNRRDIPYFRDLVLQAIEHYGRAEKKIDDFLRMPDMLERNDYSQTNVINILYGSGFLELMGKVDLVRSTSPNFVPFRIRLKGDVFDEGVQGKIRNSGYVSNEWDGRLVGSDEDIDRLKGMFEAQPFSSNDFEVRKFFKLGYLERTNNYRGHNFMRNYISDRVYRVKDEVAKAILK